MRVVTSLATVPLALLTACSGSTTAHDPTSASSPVTLGDLGAGAWVADAPRGLEGPDGPLVDRSRVTLVFDGDAVRASAGCNTFTGTASIDGGRLVVTGLGGTEMACSDDLMAQEEWYTGFLAGSPVLVLDADTLTLTGDRDTLTLTRLGEASP